MEKMNVFLSSKIVELSEDKNYLELLNRVCYYGQPNLNGTMLPYDEATQEKAQTLVGMPVVAKYTVDASGKPTFKGHEVSIDSNGELVFGTTPIGVHTEVYIQDDSVELPDKSVATLPCLFAKQKVWTRNKNAVSAIQRLFSEKNLHNSWEISVSKYEYENGTKKLLEYVFDGNCLLGTAQPAYGPSAQILSLSEDASELLVAEALSQDLIEASENSTGSEVKEMEDEKTLDTSEEEVCTGGVENGEEKGEETPAQSEEAGAAEGEEEKVEPEHPEKAELTMRDLRWKIEEALYKFADRYLDVVFIFVEAHTGWAHDWSEKETDMHEFSYSVENDEVMISAINPVSLVVSPRNINSAFDEKSSALISAQNQINELAAQVESLSPYKEAALKAAAEKIEAQRQEAIAELRKYAEKSGMVSKEELESGEIAEMISSLNETGVKVLIADRIVAKTKDKTAEVASTQKQPKVRMILDNAATDKPGEVLMNWLRKQ